MINFQSIPVSLAGAQFAYLTRGMALIEGLDVYEREVTGDLASEWASQVDALVIAFEAVGENRLAGIVQMLGASDALDWEARESFLTLLEAAPEEYQEAVGRLAEIDDMMNDPGEIRALAWDRQLEALGVSRSSYEPIALWPGTSPEMRELMGIAAGNVLERDDIRHLMHGRMTDGRPVEGKYYAKRQSNGEPMGHFGLTFSAGKSVSVRAAFASPEERARIIEAHDKAVDKVMADIAGDIAWVRRGPKSERRERGEMTWIRIRHETSRKGDPQIHTHVVVPNVVRSLVSEAVGGLDTWRSQGRINSLHRETYHRELARGLQEAGIAASFMKRGGVPEAVIEDVPEMVRDVLSQRRADGIARAEAWVGGDLSALSDHARRRVINGSVRYERPGSGEYSGDAGTWEKRLDQYAPEAWRAWQRTNGGVRGRVATAADRYLGSRIKEDKPRRQQRQRVLSRGRGEEPSGGGGGHHRFLREEEHER